MKSKRGRLITFEGIEGSGKSTHARLLAEKLRTAGHEVAEVREPGGTSIGEVIRRLLSSKAGSEKMCPRTELLLFMASRAQLVQTVILPALRLGKHVVCDRFSDSTAAYQGYARGCSLKLIAAINAFAVQKLAPDLTILLDLDLRAGFKRLHQRNRRQGTEKDRIESENMAFHQRVREGYLDLAKKNPERFCIVNAGRPVTKVQTDIWKAAKNVIER
ncbi:MAG: dTMP kinase [Kiritimatiellae bacterium]|nr:dTMP kinase [Kiritimatiellia bacterium]